MVFITVYDLSHSSGAHFVYIHETPFVHIYLLQLTWFLLRYKSPSTSASKVLETVLPYGWFILAPFTTVAQASLKLTAGEPVGRGM